MRCLHTLTHTNMNELYMKKTILCTCSSESNIELAREEVFHSLHIQSFLDV